MFIPYALADPETWDNPTPQQRVDVARFFATTVNNIGVTQLALYPLPFERAIASRFLGALSATNTIVGYIDHGLVPPNQANAIGLCFSGLWCFVPTQLTMIMVNGQPAQISPNAGDNWIPLPNGFAPKAKVIFLAACGIDANFLAQWHLGAGQVMIVPQYNTPAMIMTLNSAADEWQAMLQELANGNTVDQAVAAGNVHAAANKAPYSWQVYPQGGGGVSFKAKNQ